MEFKRVELIPGVWYTGIVSDKADTVSISIHLLTQLQRENTAVNSLIPYVLCCGTALYSDPASFQAHCDQLGILSFAPSVKKIGEVHAIGLSVQAAGKCDPRAVAEFACSGIVSPATKGGLLLQKNVDEKKKELADLDPCEDDLTTYARSRCIDEMCCYEDYSAPLFGETAEMESVHYIRLTKQYRALLQTCPIEIICVTPKAVSGLPLFFRDCLAVMSRGETDYEIGTDIRLNAVDDEVRVLNEASSENAVVFSAGYRFGECIDEADFEAMTVFCRYLQMLLNANDGLSAISVQPDLHKGIFSVTGKSDAVRTPEALAALISDALSAILSGEADKDLFSAAAASVCEEFSAVAASSEAVGDFFLSQFLCGLDYGPEEFAEASASVSYDAVSQVAETCECDLIYLTDDLTTQE